MPTFGAIEFYSQDFEGPAEEFPLDTTKVYACFEYWNMSPEVRVSGYLYLNGKEVGNVSQALEVDGDGDTCFTIYALGQNLRALDKGTWKLTLYIGNELSQSASFKIAR